MRRLDDYLGRGVPEDYASMAKPDMKNESERCSIYFKVPGILLTTAATANSVPFSSHIL